ncbi:MAG: hypothetical protein JSR66_19235 [Proteobacteria bacterium]|nr:hypothetical protein [Pseudomonadota bacterium]
MYLLDQIAQCRTPFVVVSENGSNWRLSGAADAAADIRDCPTRYVLSDDLTTVCTDLAYSKGARVFDCMDLLRIPAKRLWVEWSYRPWVNRMSRYGFKTSSSDGRFGVLLRSSADGLEGSLRSFWNFGAAQPDVYASSVVSHFRLDGSVAAGAADMRVYDFESDPDNILSESFRFGFEESWGSYYRSVLSDAEARRKVLLVSMSPMAPAIPFLLAFLLLLLNRDGLPQEPARLGRLNAARGRCGKHALLDHIQVRAPMFARAPTTTSADRGANERRAPRLHHVRGHLVRRADQLFWRVPHLRGSARLGVIQSRTVTWTVGPRNTLSCGRVSDPTRNDEHTPGVMSVNAAPT